MHPVMVSPQYRTGRFHARPAGALRWSWVQRRTGAFDRLASSLTIPQGLTVFEWRAGRPFETAEAKFRATLREVGMPRLSLSLLLSNGWLPFPNLHGAASTIVYLPLV